MSNYCTCNDTKQTKKVNCHKCKSLYELDMNSSERMKACPLHYMLSSIDETTMFRCQTCMSGKFYVRYIDTSWRPRPIVKKRNILCNCLNWLMGNVNEHTYLHYSDLF